jgi:hypothetical protein
MCLKCGCGEPNERHIRMDDVTAAAGAWAVSVDEAARTIAEGRGRPPPLPRCAD